MKKILLSILLSIPLMSFGQALDSTIFVGVPFAVEIEQPKEENINDSIVEFTQEMIRPHIEDTIKQEDLPMFLTSSAGDTIGIILTVEQVQNLDHKAEIGELLEKALIECDQLDVFYIQVINGLENQVVIYEEKISNLTDQETKRSAMIKKLQTGLAQKESQLDISNDQLFNNEIIISNLEKDLKKQKMKTIVGSTTGGIIGAIGVALGIFFGTR